MTAPVDILNNFNPKYIQQLYPVATYESECQKNAPTTRVRRFDHTNGGRYVKDRVNFKQYSPPKIERNVNGWIGSVAVGLRVIFSVEEDFITVLLLPLAMAS